MTIEIFDKHPDADAYRVGGFYSPYCLVSRDKRFSDAELAAESWRQKSWFDTAWRRAENCPSPSRALIDSREDQWERLATMESFATRPHAHENDYQ